MRNRILEKIVGYKFYDEFDTENTWKQGKQYQFKKDNFNVFLSSQINSKIEILKEVMKNIIRP